MPIVEIAGRAVFHLGGPGGPPGALPVVCLHGAGGSAAVWSQLHAALRAARPFYAPDLPGHGRSAPLGGPVTVEAYTGAVQAFVDAVGLPRALLVGHSMGAAIALRLALDAPDRVAGLVLVGGSARLRVAPDLLAALAGDFEAAVARVCRLAYGPATSPTLLAGAMAEMRRIPPALLEADFRACDAFDVRDRLREILAPSLVLVGDQDLMTPPLYATRLARGLPRGELEVLAGAGHMLPVEAAGPLAAATARLASRIELFP